MNDDLLVEVKLGNLEKVKALVAGGADINAQGQFGWTALHLAIYDWRKEIIDWLLSRKPNVNVKAEDGCTVLHYAVNYGDRELVEFLMTDHGVDVNAKNNQDQTPLAVAIDMQCPEEIIDVLKKHGATV